MLFYRKQDKSNLELLETVAFVETLVVVGVEKLELDELELVLLELTLEDVEDTVLVVGVLTLGELELETLQAKTNQQKYCIHPRYNQTTEYSNYAA